MENAPQRWGTLLVGLGTEAHCRQSLINQMINRRQVREQCPGTTNLEELPITLTIHFSEQAKIKVVTSFRDITPHQ